MKVLVDADSCPVITTIERISKQFEIPVILFFDTSHEFHSEYCEARMVGQGKDAVDFALINTCEKGDVIVTRDYGVAAMALAKRAYAIHNSGRWYTEDNIDQMLMERHINQKSRRTSGKNLLKGLHAGMGGHTRFAPSFVKLLEMGKQAEQDITGEEDVQASGERSAYEKDNSVTE